VHSVGRAEQLRVPLAKLCLSSCMRRLSASGNLNTSKTKDTNKARMAEMLVRLVWTYICKNVRSFGSPKRYLYKIRGKDTTFSPIMQTLFYNFSIFLQKNVVFYTFRPSKRLTRYAKASSISGQKTSPREYKNTYKNYDFWKNIWIYGIFCVILQRKLVVRLWHRLRLKKSMKQR